MWSLCRCVSSSAVQSRAPRRRSPQRAAAPRDRSRREMSVRPPATSVDGPARLRVDHGTAGAEQRDLDHGPNRRPAIRDRPTPTPGRRTGCPPPRRPRRRGGPAGRRSARRPASRSSPRRGRRAGCRESATDATPNVVGAVAQPGQRDLRGGGPRSSATARITATTARLFSRRLSENRGMLRRKSDGLGQVRDRREGARQEARGPAASRARSRRRARPPSGTTAFDVATPDRPLALHGGDRVDGDGGAQLVGRHLREAEMAHLARRDEFGHRADGLLDRHGQVAPVHVVEVDDVGLQPVEALVDALPHVGGVAARGGLGRRRGRPGCRRCRTSWRA